MEEIQVEEKGIDHLFVLLLLLNLRLYMWLITKHKACY
jgi:hypothetical protein